MKLNSKVMIVISQLWDKSNNLFCKFQLITEYVRLLTSCDMS